MQSLKSSRSVSPVTPSRHVATSKRIAALLIAASVVGACATSVAEKEYQISGQVITETGDAIGQAQVRLGSDVVLATDTTGTFSTVLNRGAGTRVTVTFSAPGYATVYRTIATQVAAQALPAVRLRTVDRQVNVTLPGAGDPPAVVQVTRGEGYSSLALTTGSVVVPGGNVVQGNITVSMTYWHPQEALDSAPALLVANENNMVVPLETFGMTSVELWQNGNLLQVAPNHTVALSFAQPSGMQARLSVAMPNLYYLDPNTGIWTFQGSTTDGTMTYDKTTVACSPPSCRILVPGTSMAHLYPTGGGCVEGHVYDACNPATPLASHRCQGVVSRRRGDQRLYRHNRWRRLLLRLDADFQL